MVTVGQIIEMTVFKVAGYACWGTYEGQTGFMHLFEWSKERPIPEQAEPKVDQQVRVKVFHLTDQPYEKLPSDVTYGGTIKVDFGCSAALLEEGVYVTVEGIVEAGQTHVAQLDAIFERAKTSPGLPLFSVEKNDWCRSRPHCWTYLFYCRNVLSCLDHIRRLAEEIAAVGTGEADAPDYVSGSFSWHDEEKKDGAVWELHGGKVEVRASGRQVRV